ncbi:MAG: hypothetical protein ACJZ9F_10045 [Rhodospirillaceae bacterium]
MKLSAMGMDANDRSILTDIEIPMKKVSETELISEKQDALYWGIALSQPQEPFPGGPHEQHLTNGARIVWVMQGHAEITQQDGVSCRLASGEGIYVDGRALHHSSFANSRVPVITLNVTFDETENYDFK